MYVWDYGKKRSISGVREFNREGNHAALSSVSSRASALIAERKKRDETCTITTVGCMHMIDRPGVTHGDF